MYLMRKTIGIHIRGRTTTHQPIAVAHAGYVYKPVPKGTPMANSV